MNILPLFATPFGEEILSDDVVQPQDIVDCVTRLDTGPELGFEGGWQSGWIDHNTPELAALTRVVLDRSEQFRELLNVKPTVEVSIANCWINRNESHSPHLLHNNDVHQHAGYWMSFVYYAQVWPGAGQLSLVTPNPASEWCFPDWSTNSSIYSAHRWNITPQTGLLIAFPAYTQHHAWPNLSGEDRISVAYNTRITNGD